MLLESGKSTRASQSKGLDIEMGRRRVDELRSAGSELARAGSERPSGGLSGSDRETNLCAPFPVSRGLGGKCWACWRRAATRHCTVCLLGPHGVRLQSALGQSSPCNRTRVSPAHPVAGRARRRPASIVINSIRRHLVTQQDAAGEFVRSAAGARLAKRALVRRAAN